MHPQYLLKNGRHFKRLIIYLFYFGHAKGLMLKTIVITITIVETFITKEENIKKS